MKTLIIALLFISSTSFAQVHTRANENDEDTWFTSQEIGYGLLQTRSSTLVGVENFGFMRASISYSNLDRRGEVYYRGEGYGANIKVIFKSPIVNMGFGTGGYVSKFFVPAQDYKNITGVRTYYSELTLERYILESLMISIGARNNRERVPKQEQASVFQEVSFAITLFGR